MKKLDWGNTPQWVSAISAIALAGLAFYGVFFSTTGQALVGYLQSELAVRNQRIATMELREQQLQLSITNAQENLSGLARQKAELDERVSGLRDEQQRLSKRVTELGTTLSDTAFLLVKEKIGAKKSSTISELMTMRIRFMDIVDQPGGVPAQQVRPWESYLGYVNIIASELPEADRSLARTVVEKFVRQCASANQAVIQVPALRIPKDADYSPYGWNRDKHPVNIRLDAIGKQIEAAEKKIDDCFQTVTP